MSEQRVQLLWDYVDPEFIRSELGPNDPNFVFGEEAAVQFEQEERLQFIANSVAMELIKRRKLLEERRKELTTELQSVDGSISIINDLLGEVERQPEATASLVPNREFVEIMRDARGEEVAVVTRQNIRDFARSVLGHHPQNASAGIIYNSTMRTLVLNKVSAEDIIRRKYVFTSPESQVEGLRADLLPELVKIGEQFGLSKNTLSILEQFTNHLYKRSDD